MSERHVVWFEEIGLADIPQVGGKNASLGEMVGSLAGQGVRVPDGFATTADAYRAFITENGIESALRTALASYHAGEATLRVTMTEKVKDTAVSATSSTVSNGRALRRPSTAAVTISSGQQA